MSNKLVLCIRLQCLFLVFPYQAYYSNHEYIKLLPLTSIGSIVSDLRSHCNFLVLAKLSFYSTIINNKKGQKIANIFQLLCCSQPSSGLKISIENFTDTLLVFAGGHFVSSYVSTTVSASISKKWYHSQLWCFYQKMHNGFGMLLKNSNNTQSH